MSHLFYSLVLLASALGSGPAEVSATGGAAEVEAVRPANATAPIPSALQLAQLPFGETLVYRGRVKKAGLTFDIGRAFLRASHDDEGRPFLEARAHGEKFGYELNTRITSMLEEVTLRPAVHLVAERGTERRTKKLVFREGGADFVRLKHCKDEDCEDPAHFIKQANMRGGLIPWGTEQVHCGDADCKHREHYEWRTRLEHDYEVPYFDLLSAVYLARQVEFSPGAEPVVIPIVNDKRRWSVKVHARRTKRMKVAAGTFDAVEVILEPAAADTARAKSEGDEDDAGDEKFQGLFGLNGAIQIWLDRETRRPIKIEGSLPFAFLDLHAEIELERISQETD